MGKTYSSPTTSSILGVTSEDGGSGRGSIGQVGAGGVLFIAGGAPKAAVAAGVSPAAVARNLSAVHAQSLQPLLQLLIRLAVLLDACTNQTCF